MTELVLLSSPVELLFLRRLLLLEAGGAGAGWSLVVVLWLSPLLAVGWSVASVAVPGPSVALWLR